VSPSAAATASPEAAGERRHLTILFCDLVGSVTLTSQLDPEEWRATVAGYQRATSEAIMRFGGEVVRYIGDGIMAFFGYPVAHDNDAERAARAGLAILDGISQLNQQPTHPKLAVRIGIDSGPVVVGTGAGQAVDAFGDAANIAARVQATAEPQTVVMTGATHRLISGLFVVEDRGAQTLKGIEEPVQLCRVVRPSGMRGRFEAAVAAGGLTPFVGREDELRTLMNRWERVREGEGQVVTIVGEAGIGKSRLVRQFREQIASDSHTWLECATTPFFQNTPFYAVAEMLEQSLQWEHRFTALEASLKGLSSSAVVASKVAPYAANRSASGLSPEEERKRLLARLVEWALETPRNQPLVLVIEDLHWADPSTLELIQLLVEQGATARLLLLYTARPEFRAQWPLRAHHTQITLNRLTGRNVRTMIEEMAAREALADDTVAALVERTGGVPLFIEELTRAVLEGGANLAGRAIPVTLHDSLMARLDRLGSAKEVAQIGAVIGAEFSYELLHAVHPIAEPELQRSLRSLTDAELLYVRHRAGRQLSVQARIDSRRRLRSIAQKPAQRTPFADRGSIGGSIPGAGDIGAGAAGATLHQSGARRASRSILAARRPERRALYRQIGETDELFPVLWGLWHFYMVRGELRIARESAEQLLTLAQREQDVSLLLQAHYSLGVTLFQLGEFTPSRKHFEQCNAMYDRQQHHSLALMYGSFDTGVVSLSFTALVLWLLGYPDQAFKKSQKTLSLAQALAHPFSLALAHLWTSWLHQLGQDERGVLAEAEAAIRISTERGFSIWLANGAVYQGWALVVRGQCPEGLAHCSREWVTFGQRGQRPMCLLC
jgi:class 3 adenylate cyclase